MTTRIITFLVGNPYKPLFATVTGKGPHPKYEFLYVFFFVKEEDVYNIFFCLFLVNKLAFLDLVKSHFDFEGLIPYDDWT